MNNILFKHELFDAWHQPISVIEVLDDTKNNVMIDRKPYTLEYKCIEKIIQLLSDPELYSRRKVVPAPVLDGTKHKVYMSNGIEAKVFEETNLWYWKDENSFEHIKEVYNNGMFSEEDVEYTKKVINLIEGIQKVLDDNNINFKILVGE